MRAIAAVAFMLVAMSGNEAAADQASAVIQGLNGKFIDVMRNADALGYEGRYRSLGPALAEAYDFAEMARVTAGRYWREFDETQRAELIQAFADYSTANYAARFNGFSGERFHVLGEEPAPAGAVRVNNQIVTGAGDPIRIDYLLREKDGRWRIVDVYLKATVSELALRRAEFTQVLAADGFAGLLAHLRTQAEELRREARAGGG
jgi:phospholipid transport system substrate-binding protein